jgi:hypothetical protein
MLEYSLMMGIQQGMYASNAFALDEPMLDVQKITINNN